MNNIDIFLSGYARPASAGLTPVLGLDLSRAFRFAPGLDKTMLKACGVSGKENINIIQFIIY